MQEGYVALAVENRSTASRVICIARVFHGMLIRHSFFSDQSPTYQAEAAHDAWQRTLAIFNAHLQGTIPSLETLSKEFMLKIR